MLGSVDSPFVSSYRAVRAWWLWVPSRVRHSSRAEQVRVPRPYLPHRKVHHLQSTVSSRRAEAAEVLRTKSRHLAVALSVEHARTPFIPFRARLRRKSKGIDSFDLMNHMETQFSVSSDVKISETIDHADNVQKKVKMSAPFFFVAVVWMVKMARSRSRKFGLSSLRSVRQQMRLYRVDTFV